MQMLEKEFGKSSNQCIQAGRMCCQSFLGYPKKQDMQTNGDTYEDLLLWSVLANRPQLATLFWMKSKNQLLGALFVSCIFRNMASKVKSVRDQSYYDQLMEQYRLFAERALNLQKKLFMEDQQLAMNLVNAEETLWDITVSPLHCAYENNMLDFISYSCCQRRLNQIWYSGIGGTLWGLWKKGFFLGCGCCFQSAFGCTRHEPNRREDTTDTFKLAKFIHAPLTKFLVHYAIFLGVLVCYSAFLLTELGVYSGLESILIYELIVYVYFFGDVLEEYRSLSRLVDICKTKLSCSKQDIGALQHSRWYRFKKYIYNFWNILDVSSYILLIIAIFIRFFKSSSTGNLARRFYSLSLFIMYMRFLQVLLMSRKLGPKIIMIKEMLKDLFRFIGILFVFMIGVGVLYHSNMYPKHVDMWNRAGWEYWRIWKIIYIPYWQIYGDSFLDTFQANSTTPCTTDESEWESNPDIERCSQYDWVLIVIAAIYMLVSNLLLVNLVIALFSYRFERVQENSEKLWRYHRYGVIMDFQTRIPTPLNLIIRPMIILVGICQKCKKPSYPDKKTDERIAALQTIYAVQCAYGE